MSRETSAEIASIAARLVGMTTQEMWRQMQLHFEAREQFGEDVRSVAASCLSQREEEITGIPVTAPGKPPGEQRPDGTAVIPFPERHDTGPPADVERKEESE